MPRASVFVAVMIALYAFPARAQVQRVFYLEVTVIGAQAVDIEYAAAGGLSRHTYAGGQLRLSTPITTDRRTTLTIRDRENRGYDQVVTLSPRSARAGSTVPVYLSRNHTVSCSARTIKTVTSVQRTAQRLLPNYMILRQALDEGVCESPRQRLVVLEQCVRLSRRLHQLNPVYAIDVEAERELGRRDSKRLAAIRNDENALAN